MRNVKILATRQERRIVDIYADDSYVCSIVYDKIVERHGHYQIMLDNQAIAMFPVGTYLLYDRIKHNIYGW